METRAGTKLYMAPEVFQRNYSSAWDMWSLGVILYVMITVDLPFPTSSDAVIEDSIVNLKYNISSEASNKLSEEWKDLISKILVFEEKRITPKEALQHQWLKKWLEASNSEMDGEKYVKKMEDYKDSSNLQRAILSFLASKVNEEDIKEEIKLFKKFDSNNDGYITKKELKNGLK